MCDRTFTPDFKLGWAQSWNAAVDQQFGKNVAAHTAYVGSQSYHQIIALDQNSGYFVRPTTSGGTTTYTPLHGAAGRQAGVSGEVLQHGCVTPNLAGTFGNSAKYLMQGPPVVSADLGAGKNWVYRESYDLQFRWERFNAFNHPSFANPAVDASSPASFGEITSIGPILPRVIQGALKLTF